MLSVSPATSRFTNFSDHRRYNHHRLSNPPPSPRHRRNPQTLRLRRNFQISAIDAAQPFDYESRLSTQIAKSKTLKIAIVGFGNFGQFLAKTLVRQGHTVLAYSRTDYSAVAEEIGVNFYSNADDLCEEHPEHAAELQFITQTVGRVLEKLDFDSTPINTKGYERLLDLVENELYYGLFMYNKNAMEQLERLDFAFEALKKELLVTDHEFM